jgi:hypothetical protein
LDGGHAFEGVEWGDGLQRLLKECLEAAGMKDYFLFDMSVPDALQSINCGLRTFTRQSDLEKEPALYNQAQGVWMDAFYDDAWITPDAIRRHLDHGKRVCVVSPELHGREHRSIWQRLANDDIRLHADLILCTDLPEEACTMISAK